MRILTIASLLISFSAYSQSSISVQLDYSRVFNSVEPYIYNMPHQSDRFTAIDGNKFTDDKNAKPLKFWLPISLTVGKDFVVKKGFKLNVGLKYSRYTRSSDQFQRMRFIDQLDSNQGFVMPTRYGIEMSHFLYQTAGATVGLSLDHYIDGVKNRVGLGVNVERIFKSTYFLNGLTPNDVMTDYSDTDLTSKDNIWIIMPSLNYDTNVLSRHIENWWITTSFRLNLQDKYEKGPMGHIATLGIKKYL